MISDAEIRTRDVTTVKRQGYSLHCSILCFDFVCNW